MHAEVITIHPAADNADYALLRRGEDHAAAWDEMMRKYERGDDDADDFVATVEGITRAVAAFKATTDEGKAAKLEVVRRHTRGQNVLWLLDDRTDADTAIIASFVEDALAA